MKFKAFEAKNGLNINHRKESKFSKEFTVLVNGRNYDGKPCLHELIQLRIYWTDSRAYACIWIHGGRINFTPVVQDLREGMDTTRKARQPKKH